MEEEIREVLFIPCMLRVDCLRAAWAACGLRVGCVWAAWTACELRACCLLKLRVSDVSMLLGKRGEKEMRGER